MKVEPVRTAPLDNSRRRFLKTGVAGSLMLGLASTGVALTGCSGKAESRCESCLWLTVADRIVLTALVPVMLSGALPSKEKMKNEAIAEIVVGVDYTIAHFSPAIRNEIRQLFDLLQWSITRSLLTGITQPWDQASAVSINTFLSRWQHSRFGLLRSGYTALHDLICGAWYVNPASWSRIGYSGPPAL